MSEKLKQIGQRMRDLREIAGLSIEAMGQQFKVPPALYAKYEAGETDIPVSFLVEVAQHFNVELTALLTGGDPHLHSYCLVRKDKGLTTKRRKEYKYQDLAFNFVHKKAEAFLVSVDPKPARTAVHYYAHPGQEFNYVIKGTLKILLDGHEVMLSEGDSLYFDAGIKHAMRAVGQKPAKFLAVIL
ncbi:MAG: helix-turn-helix domain-containing protein [Deltaproteobacteria bacterium]